MKWIRVRLSETEGAPWPWTELTRLTYGRRSGEVYLFGAGVGVGKTDLFTECIAFDVATLCEPVGAIFLEQPVAETVQRVAGKLSSKLFHIPGEAWTPEEYRRAIDDLEKADRLWLYNHFGALRLIRTDTVWAVIAQKGGQGAVIYHNHVKSYVEQSVDDIWEMLNG